MVPNADESPRPLDLDALIGDVRQEAARRRAEPGFPLDDEARLGVESARQAPRPPGPALEDLADAAASMARPAERSDHAGPIGRTRELATSVLRRPPAEGRGTPALAGIVARALRVSATLLGDLDRRLQALEERDGSPVFEGVQPPGPAADLTSWTPRLGEHLRSEPGRVLCIGLEPDGLVGDLREHQIDAYGVTPAGDPYRTHPDLRHGDPLEHLRSVEAGALGAVVIVEPLSTGTGPGLRSLAAELTRVSGTILVLSEAPWWWARRVGPVEADLAADRPHNPETWLEVLDGSGYEGTVRYDHGGHSYLVVAGPRP